MFIFERERDRDRVWAGEGQREKETQNPKRAPGSELSAQSPTRGSNSHTVRSWPELKSVAQPTEPPRHPTLFLKDLLTRTRILGWLFLNVFLCWDFIYVFQEYFSFKKNFFNVCLFLRERERTRREGAEREGDTESEAGSRLWAVSTESDVGLELTNREIMTWAEVGRSTDWGTQAPLVKVL